MRNLYNKILSRVRGPVALLLMLLCGVLPSAASTETATRLYDSSKLELTRTAEADGSEYLHVSLPGLDQTATPGEPQLPVEYIRFLVPVYTKVTGVSAEARSTFPRSSSIRVYPAQLPDSTYYALWDGDGNMSRALVDGNQISNPYAGEYCFSLWKSGYLPVITLFGQKGTLSKAKRYIVRNVVLGNPSADSSQSSTYSVGNEGNLSVHAIDKVSTYTGFEIQNGGIAEFDCDQTVELKGGTVKKGGKLVIKAKQISMSDGFRVEEGGILQIENK